jgi:hypothetical protein
MLQKETEKRKFVFLDWQTINGNRRLLCQSTCLSMSVWNHFCEVYNVWETECQESRALKILNKNKTFVIQNKTILKSDYRAQRQSEQQELNKSDIGLENLVLSLPLNSRPCLIIFYCRVRVHEKVRFLHLAAWPSCMLCRNLLDISTLNVATVRYVYKTNLFAPESSRYFLTLLVIISVLTKWILRIQQFHDQTAWYLVPKWGLGKISSRGRRDIEQ